MQQMATVKDEVLTNRKLFYRLSKSGIDSIKTALDYLSIYEQYESHKHIESSMERKRVIAANCKVKIRTVENAIRAMKRVI